MRRFVVTILLATAVLVAPGGGPVAAAPTRGLTGAATASSSAAGAGPALAFDGDLGSGWRAASGAAGQWLRLDLGGLFWLDHVRQTFDTDGVWGFRVEGSVDGNAWATLLDQRHRRAGRTFAEPVSGLYRYVRLTVTAGGTASSRELVVGGTDQGTNLALRRPVTTSSALARYEGARATDGGTGTYWAAGSGAYPQWMRVDLGHAARVTGVEQVFKDVDRFGFRIEGSLDGVAWTMLLDRGAGARGQTFREAVAGTYRYVRLTLTSSAAGFWGGSVELRVTGFANLALGRATTASSAAAGYETARAVDGDLATFWGAPSPSLPQWLRVDLGAPAQLRRIEQSFMNDTTWRFTVEGSLDGSSWTMLVDRTAAGRHFAADVSAVVRHLRLTVHSSAAGHWGCSAELKAFGLPLARDLAVGTVATSSSHGSGFEAAEAVDGDPVSYWGAGSPSMPQWLVVDLGRPSLLQQVEQSFVDADTWRFAVEGSLDKASWTMLLDRTAGASGRVFSGAVSGTYRYLRLRVLGSAAGHWAPSQALRAIGVGAPVTARWWEETSGVMRYYPKHYRQTLASITAGLDGLQAAGYTAIELTGVWVGPPELWAGLGGTNLYDIDPSIGTMADFEALVAAAHVRGMRVHFFANPGYAHISAPFFQKAERDYRDGIDSAERNWFDFRPTRPAQLYDRWRWSPTAGAWFFAYWDATLPSFDWSKPAWRAEATRYLRFWADKGVDGFGLDAPAVYHYNDLARNNEVITGPLADYDVMLNPEGIQTPPEYPGWVTDWRYNVIHDLDVTHWGGAGRSLLLPAMDAQNPDGLDLRFKLSRDAVLAVGGATLTAPSWEIGGVPPAQRLLEIATLTTMGTLFYLHNGNHLILPHETVVPTWPAADQARLTALVKAQSAYDGLSPVGLRTKLPTNDNRRFYAFKRLNADGSVAALVVLNYTASAATVSVDLTGAGIALAQTPVDLVGGGPAAPIGGPSYAVALPAYGYAILAVEPGV